MRDILRPAWPLRATISRAILAAVATAVCLIAHARAAEQNLTFFRIATGPTATTSYDLGTAIAIGISKPPGSRACDAGGLCGVPGLIAVAQTQDNALESMAALASGELESAIVPGDIAYWAYFGGGPFTEVTRVERLRMIANLAPFTMHIVTDADLGIESVRDLRGRRVSLGPEGSSARLTAESILRVHGVEPEEIEDPMLAPGPSADALINGQIDAFFVLGAGRVETVADVMAAIPTKLLPIAPDQMLALQARYPFVAQSVIDPAIYGLDAPVPTLTVSMKWVTTTEQPDALIRDIARALWSGAAAEVYQSENPGVAFSDGAQAILTGGAPLHPGAKAYYDQSIRAATGAEQPQPADAAAGDTAN
ncbi:MAG: TAXI family TRAP transporter solute-binding subunit [Alphaproteobacteria bacterium]|nr:TAXI family TRAP transporter solute-binding subunit [Alphaproteobacteria bacterium]